VVRRFLILIASLAVLLAACGGTTGETTTSSGDAARAQDDQTSSADPSDTQSETSDVPAAGDDGELTINDFIPGAVSFDENTDFHAQEMEIQQEIAQCMAAEGFEYVPFVPSDVGGGFAGGEFDEEEYVKTYGFGVSTWVLQEAAFNGGGDFEDPYANDPNQEIVESMDELEQEEYYRVLYGGEPDIITNTPQEELEAMTEEELMAFYDEAYANWQPDGCQNAAYDGAYGGGESQMAFWDEFGDDYEAVYERVQSDQRILDAQAEWSACMADNGYDYASQDDMYAYFYGDENGPGPFQQKVDELITWPEYPEGGFVEGDGAVTATTVIGVEEGSTGEGEYVYQGPEYDLEQLQPLIDEEIAVATANYECSQSMQDLFEEVYKEYEQIFIEENLDRLTAFKEANS
jgi:hypothetical protein